TSPRIALAGSVSFSRTTLARLLAHHANVAGVLGLSEAKSRGVSDYARLDDLARDAGVEYVDFASINEDAVVDAVRRWQPDVLFVVGLSQLVRDEVMSIPARGCVGFHPTRLPKGRGRAPVAWLTWFGIGGAATFFQIDEGVDSGPIFVQEPFDVRPGQYSEETIATVNAAIERALDRWLPSLIAGDWSPTPQDHSQATYWGRRAAEDGFIDWNRPASEIARLVRTAGRPYPGAYTYNKGKKAIIWRADVDENPIHLGITGRILSLEPDGTVLVQTGDGVLRIRELELEEGEKLAVGAKLGHAER
ncbi:MAG: methionyl-tRNA formyltransferase, partial [Thermoanaerobaculia bacterium]